MQSIVVDLQELTPLFRNAAREYDAVESWHGDSIGYLLQEDTGVFSERIESDPDVRDALVRAIFAAGRTKDDVDDPDYDGPFCRPDSATELEWVAEVEAEMRSEPPRDTQADRIEDRFPPLRLAIEDLAEDLPRGTTWWRARIHDDRFRRKWFASDEMGAPPPSRAKDGRAGRKGVPVLYMARDEETAIAEVRAWRGTAVALVAMTTVRDLRLLDLVSSRSWPSPFFTDLPRWHGDIAGLLSRLGEELSWPVIPGEDPILYRASQRLGDIVHSCGLDGVVYPTSMGPKKGANVVLFDVNAASPGEPVGYVRLCDVISEVIPLSAEESPYEDLPYGYPSS